MWDLEAQARRKPVHILAGLDAPAPLTTAFTLSLETPEKMAEEARAQSARPLLKLKLGEGNADIARARAVRAAAPDSALIVDANEGWKPEQLPELFAAFSEIDVKMVEQPLPAGKDEALKEVERLVPVCVDESCHDTASLPSLKGRYDIVNIKLDILRFGLYFRRCHGAVYRSTANTLWTSRGHAPWVSYDGCRYHFNYLDF